MTGVAIERYRVKVGVFPNSLSDVVKAGLLKEIPLDPYDAKQLRFKKTATGKIHKLTLREQYRDYRLPTA